MSLNYKQISHKGAHTDFLINTIDLYGRGDDSDSGRGPMNIALISCNRHYSYGCLCLGYLVDTATATSCPGEVGCVASGSLSNFPFCSRPVQICSPAPYIQTTIKIPPINSLSSNPIQIQSNKVNQLPGLAGARHHEPYQTKGFQQLKN